jgi:hypothetical protein
VRRIASALPLIVSLVAGCASTRDTITQQQEKLESLGATAQMIGEYWLAGQLSATYAETALEQTQAQVEQQRSVLAAQPAVLEDPHGADLSERADRLSRLVVQLRHDVAASDPGSLRRHLDHIPIVPDTR